MKKMILAAFVALALPAWAQAPEQKAVAATPAAMGKSAPKAKAVRKATAKRYQDARHCLQQPNNDAIIRCAEEYL